MLRAAVLLSALAMTACGGGGDDGPTIEPLHLSVASSEYHFTNDAPLQDVKFPSGTFTNHGPGALTVTVSAKSARVLIAPASAGGSLTLFVGIVDTTANQLVLNGCDMPTGQVAPNARLEVAESMSCAVTIPEGHTFSFTPFARVLAEAPNASGFVLTTSGYELTVQ